MNLLLIRPEELAGADPRSGAQVVLDDRRAVHILRVLKKQPGDTLRAGLLHGALGRAEILAVEHSTVRIACFFDRQPPPLRPCTAVLALPRPPVLRRVLSHFATIGIPRIVLVQTKRVEKSYWSSPALEPDSIEARLLEGLEQGGDTRLPQVDFRRRFRPFVEDELPVLAKTSPVFVGDPSGSEPCPTDVEGPVTFVVGPEGGFIDFEVGLMRDQGCTIVRLGTRILRVEAAAIAMPARLGVG